MALVDRLFGAIASAVQMRADLDRITSQQDKIEITIFDHEKRLIRLETRDEMVPRDVRPPRRRLAPPPDSN